MPLTMDDANALSAFWLFLSAKKQAGCPIGTGTGVIPDSILVRSPCAGFKAKAKNYADDISDGVTSATDVELGLL